MEVMGSLERFLIVAHTLRVLCVRSVDVMTSIILSSSLVPASMIVSNGLVEYCFFVYFIETVVPTINQRPMERMG